MGPGEYGGIYGRCGGDRRRRRGRRIRPRRGRAVVLGRRPPVARVRIAATRASRRCGCTKAKGRPPHNRGRTDRQRHDDRRCRRHPAASTIVGGTSPAVEGGVEGVGASRSVARSPAPRCWSEGGKFENVRPSFVERSSNVCRTFELRSTNVRPLVLVRAPKAKAINITLIYVRTLCICASSKNNKHYSNLRTYPM